MIGEQLASLERGWRDTLVPLVSRGELVDLESFLRQRMSAGLEVLPSREQWFSAFAHTPLARTRVVILGQDPYPTPGHAHGLSFSVERSVDPLPRSLRNIFRELEDDLGIVNQHGDLRGWADQGVLLLNRVLTVEAGAAGSHRGRGWELLTDAVVRRLAARETPTVFILWGNEARKQAAVIDSRRHCVLESAHPSPLSARRGFFGSRPFSRANDFLRAHGRQPINWALR